MKKFTMNQLMTMQVSLVALSQIKLPAHPAAYRVGRALDAIAQATQQPIAAMQALYRERGVLNEDGTQYAPPTDPEALAAFQAAWTEIQNREIEVELHPISVSDLGNGAIEPAHLMTLREVMILDDSHLTLVHDADKPGSMLATLTDVVLVNGFYKKVRAEQVFAVEDIEYDLFAAGWKTCAMHMLSSEPTRITT